jgi:hypothetical protein
MRSEHGSDHEFRTALRAWVRAKTGADGLTDLTPLFEGRRLRSVHVPELLLLLERLRGAPIDVEGLRPGDFRDIDTLVRRFASPGAGAAP